MVRRPLAELVFLHGVGAYSGRYQRLALALNARQINVWATDALGNDLRHGRQGQMPSMDVLTDNLRTLSNLAARRSPGVPLIVGGHSLGGTAAALSACLDPDPYAGLVLSGTPITPLQQVEALTDGAPVSLDLSYLHAVSDGPIGSTGQVTVVSARTLTTAWAELANRFEKLPVPVMFVHGVSDSIVPLRDNHVWTQRMPLAQLDRFDARHDVINASTHHRVATTIADFVLSAAIDHAAA
jgi:alpha-beta hydrolase superfamily lysophospholipase